MVLQVLSMEVAQSLMLEAVEVCFTPKGFRVSRPKNKNGGIQYIWRMLGFYLGKGNLVCMPVTADWYIDEWSEAFIGKRPKMYKIHTTDEEYRQDPMYIAYQEFQAKRRALIKDLDVIVDSVLAKIPKTEWAGVIRWARALGQTVEV